ncbi:hypothetical protein TrST_g11874 [Triparma strigata]|uniref:Uncharacterized protein n=1 Tax=Triparma strigata TaxID=1606541 RepID=A0A9W7BAI3_9STRA|nr:hypothetical protein TrST_g11874 [Triparma strigata]
MPKRAAVDSDADHNKRTTLLSNNMQDEDQFQGPPIFSAALPPGTSKETTHSDGTTAHRLHSFFYTDEFRYHFSDYIPSDTHLTMKFVCKGWLLLIDKYINQGTASGSILYHVGQEICCEGLIAHLLSLQRSKSAAIRKDRCERLGLTYMGV